MVMPSTNSDLWLMLMCEIEEVAKKKSVQHKEAKVVMLHDMCCLVVAYSSNAVVAVTTVCSGQA